MAPVGQALAGQLPPQAVIYRDTCCHRNDPAGAPLAHLSYGHASTGWGKAPLVLNTFGIARTVREVLASRPRLRQAEQTKRRSPVGGPTVTG